MALCYSLCIAAALLMRPLKLTEPVTEGGKAGRELSTRGFQRPWTHILCASCRSLHSASNMLGLPPPHISQLKSSWEPSLTRSSGQRLGLQKAWHFCKRHVEGEVERQDLPSPLTSGFWNDYLQATKPSANKQFHSSVTVFPSALSLSYSYQSERQISYRLPWGKKKKQTTQQTKGSTHPAWWRMLRLNLELKLTQRSSLNSCNGWRCASFISKLSEMLQSSLKQRKAQLVRWQMLPKLFLKAKGSQRRRIITYFEQLASCQVKKRC